MVQIKRVDEISIENIKGFKQVTLGMSLLPNKPNLLVASNGFGKSSIAAAFQSLNRERLNLGKDHFHRDDGSLDPLMRLQCTKDDGSTLTLEATKTSNQLSAYFDIAVINNQLIPKAKKLKISGNLIVSASIEIAPIVLVSKIPAKAKFSYSPAAVRLAFGPNGKVLPSIAPILEDDGLVCRLMNEVEFAKSSGVRANTAVTALKAAINAAGGSAPTILSGLPSATVSAVTALPHIAKIIDIVRANKAFASSADSELALAALQIVELHNADRLAFKQVAARCAYELEKNAYIEAFRALKGTWKNIAPVERKDEGLVIEFPTANRISNGERDIICFFAMLMKSKSRLQKQDSILVIDEVFDYLDDANVVAAQYYLSELIAAFKRANRRLFLILLTHLDPAYFKSYVFSKPNVIYLERASSGTVDRRIERLIVLREDSSISQDFSRYFLHYEPGSVDLTAEFTALGLPIELAYSIDFRGHVAAQLARYLSGQSYDPISVCCAVRLTIEEVVYSKLAPAARSTYLATWKTVEKLEFAEREGVAVPDVFYLLGIIYNSAMHLRSGHDNFTPLRSKLENRTIRHMVEWAANYS